MFKYLLLWIFHKITKLINKIFYNKLKKMIVINSKILEFHKIIQLIINPIKARILQIII
jgi:hypothetical protein